MPHIAPVDSRPLGLLVVRAVIASEPQNRRRPIATHVEVATRSSLAKASSQFADGSAT
jgi:hypothetical protein